jgi:hypothetical protein
MESTIVHEGNVVKKGGYPIVGEGGGKAFDFEGDPAPYANSVDTRGHPSLYSLTRKPVLIRH